jgi:hypothetical protein
MDDQPNDNQANQAPPELPPSLPPDAIADSMTSNEPEKPHGFFAGVGGAIVFVLLIGLVIGPILWWVWARSPLRIWLKIIVTILPIAILFAVL